MDNIYYILTQIFNGVKELADDYDITYISGGRDLGTIVRVGDKKLHFTAVEGDFNIAGWSTKITEDIGKQEFQFIVTEDSNLSTFDNHQRCKGEIVRDMVRNQVLNYLKPKKREVSLAAV